MCEEFTESFKAEKFDFLSVLIYACIRLYYVKHYKIALIFQKYLGGFISHEGILIGLLFKHQPIRNIGQTIEVSFLPVDGNNKLIKDSKDKGIKIIDIHLARSSNKRKRNGKEPSDKLE